MRGSGGFGCSRRRCLQSVVWGKGGKVELVSRVLWERKRLLSFSTTHGDGQGKGGREWGVRLI